MRGIEKLKFISPANFLIVWTKEKQINDFSGCDRIPIESLEMDNPESIFVVILAVCGEWADFYHSDTTVLKEPNKDLKLKRIINPQNPIKLFS